MTGFLLRLLAYSIAVYAILFFANDQLPVRFAFAGFWKIQLFMVAVAWIAHSALEKAGQKGNQYFVRQFMATTGLKLFLYMIVMVGYAVLNRESAVGFIVHFFVLYLLYSVFEIALIYKRLSAR
jgi:hypothetical protein